MKVNFGRMMRNMARHFGGSEAVVNVERGRRYSFAEYHRLTNRIANVIHQSLGLRGGDRFMLMLENDNLSLLHFPTYLKQGATAVMCNLRDSLEEHSRQAQLVQPRAAFIEAELVETHAAMLRALGCAVIVLDPLDNEAKARFPFVLQFWDLVEAASDCESDHEIDQFSDVVLMRFTGGTTGSGKCASYTLDNWFGGRDSCLMNVDLRFDAGTRFLHAAPLSHGTQLFFYPTFFTGGTTITTNGLALDGMIDLIQLESITHSFLVPTVLYRLLDAQRQKPRDLGSLRTLIYGAAPISADRLGELVAEFGSIFVQAYAATEAVVVVSLLEREAHLAETPEQVQRLSSAGRITPGIEAYVADEAGNELPVGERGEIRIRGRGVISGYDANPEASATEFVDGAWKSGDLGYIDQDGYLYIVDRLKDMIISGGFNVYASEVEAALASHPAVFMSAVVGLPHDDWGEAVHAEVQLRPGASASEIELIAHAKQLLGSYKAPKSIGFAAALPVSPVGKVLRREIRDRLRRSIPDLIRNTI